MIPRLWEGRRRGKRECALTPNPFSLRLFHLLSDPSRSPMDYSKEHVEQALVSWVVENRSLDCS